MSKSSRRSQGDIRGFFLRSQLMTTIFAMALLLGASYYELSKLESSGNTAEEWRILAHMGLWFIAALGLSILFLKGIANRVEHTISRPIVRISKIANYIELHNDYTVRLRDQAIPLSVTEIEEISSRFDSMLEDINRKDLELEKRIIERTQELQESLLALERTQKELVSSSRMAALGEMSGGVAHEINNPLCVIEQSLGILSRYLAGEEVSREIAQKMLEKTMRMSNRIGRIVHGLRTFARDAEEDPFEKVTIRSLVDDTLVLCEERFKSNGIPLTVEVDSPDAMVSARAVQISQVLLNLLSNAFDAIMAMPEPWVRLSVKDDDDGVRFEITDSGAGIPEEIKEKIFQPFFTTKEVGKGTGLGLSISKGIIDAHGGKLVVCSESKNTRLCFRLARVDAQSQSAA